MISRTGAVKHQDTSSYVVQTAYEVLITNLVVSGAVSSPCEAAKADFVFLPEICDDKQSLARLLIRLLKTSRRHHVLNLGLCLTLIRRRVSFC